MLRFNRDINHIFYFTFNIKVITNNLIYIYMIDHMLTHYENEGK